MSRRFPPAHRTVDRGHGRIEQRTTWVAPAPPDLNFPHAAQVVIVQRHTTDLAGKHPHTELVYAVTCLTADQADAERLGALLRAHWQVEGLHWVRDVTFAEDASRIRTSAGPQVMAALRNLAIGLLRQAGQTRIAAGLRHIGRDPARALAFLGLP